MKLEDINKVQGANKLVRQWNSMRDAVDPPSRIMLQAQGARHSNANMAVMDTDPEFADLWALLKAVVDRKYAEQVDVLVAAGVTSPDAHPGVVAASKQKLGK